MSDQQNGNEGGRSAEALGADLAVGELRAVIMGGEENPDDGVVTLAAKVPDGVLDHANSAARVGFFPGLIVAEEEGVSVPLLVLFLIVNDHVNPPCHLPINITNPKSKNVLSQIIEQERIHLMLVDGNGAKALTLGGNPASRVMLPKLVAHAQQVSPNEMPDESFWKVSGAIYHAFGGPTGLLTLFSNLLESGQELPIHTFKPSEMEPAGE